MFNIFTKREKEQIEYSVCNIEIKRSESRLHLREYDNTSKFIGEFMLQNSGRLDRGINIDLHLYKTALGHCDDHIHLLGETIIDIYSKDKELYLRTEIKNPKFTLNGFYKYTKSRSAPNKIKSLIEEIKTFNENFQFNSIATREETKLKLLENAYKRHVSNQ